MTSRRRNDRYLGPATHAGERGRRGVRRPDFAANWLWGVHAVRAALDNPARPQATRLVVTAERAHALDGRGVRTEILAPRAIDALLPRGAVHQGAALEGPPLDPVALDDLAGPAEGLLLVLDQVTDPQNVGAIFRSAAAFGARGIILQERHAPALTGALAKAAAGAIDRIAHARVVNLSRALEHLGDLGWRTVGLDGEAADDLDTAVGAGPTVLVLGSEAEGLRRLVREHCDVLARIPMPGGFESLNVSAAAAVALYEASRAGRSRR